MIQPVDDHFRIQPTSITGSPTPGSNSIISVASYERGDSVIVEVAGELDLWASSYLDDALMRAVEHQRRLPVRLDVFQVSFVDLSGWRPISDAAAVLQSRGDYLLISAVSDRVRRFLDLIGLDPGIRIEELQRFDPAIRRALS